ncbi:NO-inducible flavohemoprotein [Marinobacterium rhizophilum]|uniref:Flavohemoprotein n=1 Tax=Marinobacterium rhizophilum TaxID=420402 RepID=A0ABY5HRU4_9GAMM|nr:NO-inducible flavohemoprotein [Marinobacterium rhizophilum]UTW13924.1 NO-inducible flavohemoprotein [Marinobacterium rhizophilum]
MLQPDQIATVQATLPLLESAGPALTEHFYARMFRDNPELKDVFNLAHQTSGAQPVALFNAILAYARHLHNPAVLSQAVERIAQKHTGFLIRPQQYAIVGHHLLETIRELAPDAATPEVLHAWELAYGQLAQIFIDRESEIYDQAASADGGWRGTRRFRLVHKTAESQLITSFEFAPVDGKAVSAFKPGQYLTVSISHPSLKQHEYRQYSLSDAPNGRSYRISVKREDRPVPGQVSTYLHDELQVGDEIDLLPPAGDFYLEVQNDAPVVLLSGGVGLTPMLSMFNSLAQADHPGPVYFLHGCENGRQHAFARHVADLCEARESRHSFTWYQAPLETDIADQDYQATGLMDLAPLRAALDTEQTEYYFCGPLPFMQAIHRQLKAWGVADCRLHYELFGPHQAL